MFFFFQFIPSHNAKIKTQKSLLIYAFELPDYKCSYESRKSSSSNSEANACNSNNVNFIADNDTNNVVSTVNNLTNSITKLTNGVLENKSQFPSKAPLLSVKSSSFDTTEDKHVINVKPRSSLPSNYIKSDIKNNSMFYTNLDSNVGLESLDDSSNNNTYKLNNIETTPTKENIKEETDSQYSNLSMDSEPYSLSSDFISCTGDLDKASKGFVVGYQRKMVAQEVFFLATQQRKPVLFGLPLVVPLYEYDNCGDQYSSDHHQTTTHNNDHPDLNPKSINSPSMMRRPNNNIMNSPDMKRTSNILNSPNMKRTNNIINSPDMKRSGNIINSSERKQNGSIINSPNMKRANNTINSPDMRRTSNITHGDSHDMRRGSLVNSGRNLYGSVWKQVR